MPLVLDVNTLDTLSMRARLLASNPNVRSRLLQWNYIARAEANEKSLIVYELPQLHFVVPERYGSDAESRNRSIETGVTPMDKVYPLFRFTLNLHVQDERLVTETMRFHLSKLVPYRCSSLDIHDNAMVIPFVPPHLAHPRESAFDLLWKPRTMSAGLVTYRSMGDEAVAKVMKSLSYTDLYQINLLLLYLQQLQVQDLEVISVNASKESNRSDAYAYRVGA